MAGDLGYALMINGLYGPAVALAAHKTGDLPFIMGQLMLFRREALASIGGLASADGHLVDDMRLGACLAEAGWRNIPSYHPLPIMTGGMDVPTFLKLMRRWLFFQKAGLPMAFTWPLWMRGLVFALGIVLSIWAVAAGYPLIAMVPFLATITVSWSIATLHREFGGAPVALRHIWVPLGVLFAGPIAQAAVLLKPSVNWRGRDYALDSDARLEGWGGTAHSEPGMAVGGFDADDDPGYDPSMGRVPAPIASHYNHKSPGGFRSPVRN
jgi:ceramide glucosyltransferase